MGQIFERTIEEIARDANEDYNELQELCIAYERECLAGGIEKPCLECDACMTFVETQRIVYGYLFDGKDRQWVEENTQYVRKARGQDRILRHLHSIQTTQADYNRSAYEPNHKMLVYLDHNILDKYHKDDEVRSRLTPGNVVVQYVYSPSHLEEIKRMKDEEEEQRVLETIREVTSTLFISNFEDSELSLAYEDPYYGWSRVLKNGEVAQDVEAYRVITTDDRKIFYPEHTDENYLRELTMEQVSAHPKVIGVCEQFERYELLDENGRVKNYTYVHQAIHSMVRTLDNIGYKTDKKRAILSSAHDIEHMIYATGTDIFVTMDGKFRERAQFIYKKFGISTTVMDWNQYAVYVDSLA
ncbi:hypothetical protein HQN89_34000 [Paenibacillus frigoriresistens]|nr:hypothetical protein [Paenibacillus frigoriresistens]